MPERYSKVLNEMAWKRKHYALKPGKKPPNNPELKIKRWLGIVLERLMKKQIYKATWILTPQFQ